MSIADEYVPFIIASTAFLVICLLFLGITILFRRRQHQREMLSKIRSKEDDWNVTADQSTSIEFTGESANPFTRLLHAIGSRINTGQSRDDGEIKLKFLRAGLRGKNVPTIFMGVKLMLAVALPSAFLLIVTLFFGSMQTSRIFIGLGFLIMMGLMIPNAWLGRKTRKRKEKLVRAFPDALDLMVVCVEAGMGMDAAFRRVGEEIKLSYPELSNELHWLNLELRAGKSRMTALKNLGARTDIDDVNSLVTVLIQTDRFGTSVSRALKVYADSFRTARFQRAEELAATLGTKMIFPLALCLFPVFFVVVLGPIVVQVYHMFLKN
jgi:tight adherence protein C